MMKTLIPSLKTTRAKRDYVFRRRPLRSQSRILSVAVEANASATARPTPCEWHPAPRQKGFTLIELLVSLVILALLSIAGYRGLDAVIQTREHIAAETRKWQYLTFFFARLDHDIAQAVNRTVRDAGGLSHPEWMGHPVVVGDDDAELTFTRAGITDQGLALLPPQRIAYRLEQGRIVLLRWKVLDQAERMGPVRYTLLEGVSDFKWRYLDTHQNWLTLWPPADSTAGLPRAAEVTLKMSDGDTLTRVFALQ